MFLFELICLPSWSCSFLRSFLAKRNAFAQNATAIYIFKSEQKKKYAKVPFRQTCIVCVCFLLFHSVLFGSFCCVTATVICDISLKQTVTENSTEVYLIWASFKFWFHFFQHFWQSSIKHIRWVYRHFIQRDRVFSSTLNNFVCLIQTVKLLVWTDCYFWKMRILFFFFSAMICTWNTCCANSNCCYYNTVMIFLKHTEKRDK